jgi:hypothetical protein
MKIDANVIDELAEGLRPFDVVELLGMLTDEHRRWAHDFLLSNPPANIDPVESATSAYLALRPGELSRFRKRIRDLTGERPVKGAT